MTEGQIDYLYTANMPFLKDARKWNASNASEQCPYRILLLPIPANAMHLMFSIAHLM